LEKVLEIALMSPDLNPLRFRFWDYIKSHVCTVKIRNVGYLQYQSEGSEVKLHRCVKKS